MPARANLVHQTTTTTGTGNLTMASVNGKATFLEAFGTGGTDTFDYFISNRDVASEREWGTGHESGGALVRDTVVGGSNGTSPVNFSAGTKDVTNDVPAEKQVATDLTQTLTNKDISSATNTYRAASDTATGAIEIAVQSEMETGTSATLAVTPGRQQYHPSAAKSWLYINAAQTSILASYNISSFTDTGTGDGTANFTTAFSSTSYAPIGEVTEVVANGNGAHRHVMFSITSASACQMVSYFATQSANVTYFDVLKSAAWFGDQ